MNNGEREDLLYLSIYDSVKRFSVEKWTPVNLVAHQVTITGKTPNDGWR
jgi:hypothetical protein